VNEARPVTVGLVAGLGPESTIDYYRRLLSAWGSRHPGTAPSIVLDSLDVQLALRLVTNDRRALVAYLLESVNRLHGAGATFGAITANTPHTVFAELSAASPLPLISIVDVCAAEAERRGLRRLLILGTRFTMTESFYPEAFRLRALEAVPPAREEVGWIHEEYLGLVRGEFTEKARARFTDLIERSRALLAIDGVILGGTELPILMRAPLVAGVPLLDTTGIHVEAIVESCASKRRSSWNASRHQPQ
jgi:aspartate racemase